MIRGDAMVGVAAMGRLQNVLRRLAELPRRTAEEAKEPLNRLLREEFLNGTDPYGNPWAPLKPATLAKGRFPPPLTDKKNLRRGTKVELRGRSGLVLMTGPHGYFHQVGTRHMVARRILPQFGLPASWKIVLREAARRAARKATR